MSKEEKEGPKTRRYRMRQGQIRQAQRTFRRETRRFLYRILHGEEFSSPPELRRIQPS